MIYRLTIDGFHAGPALAEALEGLQRDRLFAKSRIQLHPGGLSAAIEHYRTNASPQLVIVEETGDEAAMIDRLHQLAEVCVAESRVVVVGGVNDIGAYRRLIAQGVSDYLVGPASTPQIIAAVESLYADPAAAPRGRLIAFFAARGGAGSSTLAHNTGWAVADLTGEDVMLVDLDQAFGTLGLAFNIEVRQTVGELLGEPERIDAQLLDRLLVKYDDHLQLLPSPSQLRDWPPIDAETIDRLLDVTRRMAPFVVLDLPHLWSPWVQHVLDMADELVLVAQPDLPNLRDLKALLDLLGERRADKGSIHLVLNKQDAQKKTQLTARDFEETLKVRPSQSIAFDPIFGEASNNGQMLGEVAKTHKLTEVINQLALQVSRRQAAQAKRKIPAKDVLAGWLKKAKMAR